MPLPFIPLAPALFGKGAIKNREEQLNNANQGAYFEGLSGLSSKDRDSWEKQYLNEISGLSDEDKDQVFRNTVFKDLYKDSEDPRDQEIWNNRMNMTTDERDLFVARKAIEEDLDGKSDLKEQGFNFLDIIRPSEAEDAGEKLTAKVSGTTLREAATKYLEEASRSTAESFRAQVGEMDSASKENLAKNINNLSLQLFPNYKEYVGTDKLDLSVDDMANLAADYSAWQNVGGDNFAYRMLNKTYQDIIAGNQSIWEKTVNTGAQFVDSGAGMIIRGAGMMAGIVGAGREAQDEDESYFDNIIDNSITRYGDRVATTQSWDAARQQYLEENGLQDYPILNTFNQQNSILSWNTPFEVLGQYGFTAASTALSFGGSAVVNGLVKGAGWAAKAATGAKGLNSTVQGIRLAKGLIRAKDIGNILVAAGIGTVEGSMNAVSTKNKVLEDLNADIERDFNAQIDSNIDEFVKNNTSEALNLMLRAGREVSQETTLDDIASAFKQDEGIRELFGKEISSEYDDRRAKAKEAANSAMVVDFIGNSIINGFINTTLQATLNAPSVQRSLRKVGLQKSPIDELGVKITRNADGTYQAAGKRFTRWNAVANRFKEAWGEGIEEYTQDLSGAFGEGFAKDKMSQYLEWKYGDSEGSDAFEEDVFRNFVTGLNYAGESAFSAESIKDGLYGILSTAVGGPNANIGNRGSNKREAGESGLRYALRRSPVAWRSALGPLFNGEANEVNSQRDETAKRINDFFSDQEKQNIFFNLEASTNIMRQAQRAMASGDEKAIRDARVAELVSSVFMINELSGSAYYDAITNSVQARANFNPDNLNDPNSIESKAAEQYIADTRNRGENLSKEEALQAIIGSAKDMLSMMDSVQEETANVEKLFGSEMDRDTKEAFIFDRVSLEDNKKRMKSLDEELSKVTSSIEKNDSGESSGLSKGPKKIIAKYGSLNNAIKAYNKLVANKQDIDEYVETTKKDIKLEGREAKLNHTLLRAESKQLGYQINTLKRDIDRYRREAPKENQTTTDAEGKEVTSKVLTGKEVLSAREIMALNAMDRADMMSLENRSLYSEAQQAEIAKVENAGSELYSDFYSKIIDRGRIEADYIKNTNEILQMTQNPGSFLMYQAIRKKEKQNRLLDKKYQYLSEYDGRRPYSDFATELTRIYEESPKEDQEAAKRVLNRSNSAYYDRYNTANNILNGIYRRLVRNEAYNKLNDNDKNLFSDTIDYLVGKGVDLENSNSVIDALSAESTDTSGVTMNDFTRYVANVNSKVDDNEKAVISSIGQVIQNFKDVMSSLKKEVQEQEDNKKPIEVQPTTPEQSTPPKAPQPKEAPGIFGNGAYQTADQGFPEGTQSPEDAFVEAIRESSGDLVAEAAKVAINTINNTPESVANNAAIKSALNKLEELKDEYFESVEDFANSILTEANKLDIEKDKRDIAAVLRRAESTVRNSSNLKKGNQAKPQTILGGLASRRFNFTSNFARTGGEPISPESNVISTLNIQWLKNKYPNGSLSRFLAKYKVEEFLSDPAALTGNRRVVKFIVDSQLVEDTKQSMESEGTLYTKDALPVVPVVEVEEKSDHVIVLNENGEEHYYQPIGVLPSTTNSWTSGAFRLGKLREYADAQEQNQLVRDDKGNVISTTIYGNVVATPPPHLGEGENRSVIRVAQDDLSAEDRRELSDKQKEEKRKTPVYQRMREQFLKRFAVERGGPEGPKMVYSMSNLKGADSTVGFSIYRTPVHKSQDKNSSKLILDLFRENLVDQALASNSRIKRFGLGLKKFFDGGKLAPSLFVPDGNGGLTLSDTGQKTINALSDELGKVLGNYIVLPSRIDGGPIRYKLTPIYNTTQDGSQQLMRDENGAPVFELSAANDKISIPLTTIVDGKVNDSNVFNALYSLFLDDNGQPRMRDNKESFVLWQIPYLDIEHMNSNKNAMDNVIDIYDDGILEASVSSFQYSVKSVSFNSPFTSEGLPNYVNTTVANGENAGTGQSSATVVTTNGTEVDASSGVETETGTGKSEKPISPAAKTASEIIENSKHIRLSEDGSNYVDDRTGKSYARVTSIIVADREASGERFDPNNPIGTGIDELVRDFFGDNLKELDSYPNTTKEQVEKFIGQLQALKNQLVAGGLTVVPRDVVVTGTLNATDTNGEVHPIDVAGTLDLLAYDTEGNFYVFDMKTFRTSIDQEKKQKYARQLSLYKKFLEDNYGVNVKSLKIIPIKVEYPAPSKQAKYGLQEGKANQLTVNGVEYTMARPDLKQMISLDYKEPDIDFERLTAEEKDMVRGSIQEEVPAPITEVSPAPKNTVPIDQFTGMPMVGYSNPLLEGMPAPQTDSGSTFVIKNLRWGVWEGLTEEQKRELPSRLEALGYTKDIWESSDPMVRPSDAEKEHQIKCIYGL